MLRRRLLLFVCLAVLFAATQAQAVTILSAQLTTAQETAAVTLTTATGAPRPEPFGRATFVLNDAMTTLTLFATIFHIDVTGMQTPDTNDNLRAAHIHAPAPPGMNAGVVWGFFGTPDNDTNPKDLVVMPFVDGVGGRFTSKWDMSEGNNTTLTAQLSNILSGLSYINFHTEQNRPGEIRGQLQVVPEPSTLLLLGSGLAVVLAFGRRRFGRQA